jgi:hypothetical protein
MYGYEDSPRTHILACVVKSESAWISFDEALGACSGNIIEQHEHHGIAIAKLFDRAVEKTSKYSDISLNSIVTDDAGQCQRAKRIL